jgi:hypothetical protein
MKPALGILTLGILIQIAPLPLAAHHNWNTKFDESKKTTLQGVIAKVEWMNPHALVWIDVKDATGKTANWQVELAPPIALNRSGLTKEMLKDGDPIAVEGWLARETSNVAAGGALTLTGGRVVLQQH